MIDLKQNTKKPNDCKKFSYTKLWSGLELAFSSGEDCEVDATAPPSLPT